MKELQNFFGDKGKNPSVKEMLEMHEALENTHKDVLGALYEIEARLDAISEMHDE